MNNSNYVISFLLIILTASLIYPQQKFIIDLSDTARHTFNITLFPEQLTDKNKIYQFAAAAPGTYEIMDVGRFVRSFHAFDNTNKEISTKQISTNQWEISTPTQTKKIEYSVSDTWHPDTKTHAIYLMSGTNLEKDNALINPHCLLGYFEGMQSEPVYIKINQPYGWETGTALAQNNEGFYTADNYDRVVDSPILLGKLSEAETKIGKCLIKIYTYSKTGMLKSSDILASVTDILNAEDKFTDGLPVDHYTFLFHFADVANGAWEHSYSSEYVLKEVPIEELVKGSLRTYISHEFFHIITPLNIHSQLIEPFNFVNPVMSQHLWFYEGTTEWAAWILQLRAGLMSLDDYLRGMRMQLITSEYFKKDMSLRDLSINAYKYPDQYQNIYEKGPVTAALLDIYLLKLSDGKKGLREIILELSKKYGVHKTFNEDTFFDEIVSMTYPEINIFIDKYIIHAEPLPLKEYFGWLGIDYEEFKGIDSSKIELGFGISVANNRIVIANVPDTTKTKMRSGDIINKLYDNPVTLENAQEAFMVLHGKKPGDEIKLILTRDGKDFDVFWKLPPAQKKHYFEISQSPTPEQLSLREAWLKNLPYK
jgi:predicted metalloprotease with PDZ domain